MVALLKEFYGRGPTRAKSYYQDDLVVCLLRGGFSQVEQTLLEGGRGAAVIQQRMEFQDLMRDRFVAVIKDATGREVIGFMSGNQQGPDIMCEVFILAPTDLLDDGAPLTRKVPMPKTHAPGDLTTERPNPQAAAAQDRARSRATRRDASCLHLAGSTAEHARRRSLVNDALTAGQLTICSERHGLTHTVAVSGELDLATAASVETELMAVEATDAHLIILDLSGLTFMDTCGVHLIAAADARCRAAAKPLGLLRGPPHIQRVLTLAATDTLAFAA